MDDDESLLQWAEATEATQTAWSTSAAAAASTTSSTTQSAARPRQTFGRRSKQQRQQNQRQLPASKLSRKPPPLRRDASDERSAFLQESFANDDFDLAFMRSSGGSHSLAEGSSASTTSLSESFTASTTTTDDPVPPKRPKKKPMSRAQTLPTISLPHIPNVPKTRRMHRSWSMALGTTSSTARQFRDSFLPMAESSPEERATRAREELPESEGGASQRRNFEGMPWLEENAEPNEFASWQIESGDKRGGPRGRRKIRARRASMQGSITPRSDLLRDGGGGARGSSSSSLMPPPSLSLKDLASPSPCKPGAGLFGDLPDILSSPSSKSVSSRKRGVCGSPICDMDDSMSSTGGLSASLNSNSSRSLRRQRSRSSIFSPPSAGSSSHTSSLSLSINTGSGSRGSGGGGFPLAPVLFERRTAAASVHECRGMDVETDDDETASNVDTSHHDASFTSVTMDTNVVPVVTIGEVQADDQDHQNEDELLRSMPAFRDLVFLLKALRKEQSSTGKTAGFGRSASWTVVPPHKWHSARRSSFFHWLTAIFGFSVRPLGNDINVLRISEVKGVELLSRLQRAVTVHRAKQRDGQAAVATHTEDQPTTKTFIDGAVSPVLMMDTSTSATKAPNRAPSTIKINTKQQTGQADEMMEDITDNLAAGLQSLTFNDKKKRHSDVSVAGLSLGDASSFANPPRPSFEHSFLGPQDIMLHMGAGQESPVEELNGDQQRPPKTSLSSVASAATLLRDRSSGGSYQNAFANAQSCLETPQIKQDEGWGSRPVPGRDWGTSTPCDDSIIEELQAKAEEAFQAAGVRDSLGSVQPYDCHLPFLPFSDSLDVDAQGRGSFGSMAEVEEEEDESLREDDAERIAKKRIQSAAKRKRMSLWTSAAQNDTRLLHRRTSIFSPPRMARLEAVSKPTTKKLSEREGEFPRLVQEEDTPDEELLAQRRVLENDEGILASSVFQYLSESDLLCTASLVCTTWADAATAAHAAMMMASVGYVDGLEQEDEDVADNEEFVEDQEEVEDNASEVEVNPIALSMARHWNWLINRFDWGCFLSSGAYKQVFRLHNTACDTIEAVSVMNVEYIPDKKIVAAELAVSALLSGLARRGMCPNFVLTRGVFTSSFGPPEQLWGSETDKRPLGADYKRRKKRKKPRQPEEGYPGQYQYIRMELCGGGDAEEFIKGLPDERLCSNVARAALFQISFALHVGAERCSLKHYDMKLLNVFVQNIEAQKGDVVLRFGVGAHVFAVRMSAEMACIFKVADYGTANVREDSNGQEVTIAQFTTLENTPPDFMILGDKATQGHGHDNWGLLLCMLHLFTGHKPYEEILEEVKCPPNLKKKLRKIWENTKTKGYSVIRSVILMDVYTDDNGNIVEGEPDETMYHTLYKYLVLFGIPEDKFCLKECPRVWKAITESLQDNGRSRRGTDVTQFEKDRRRFSIQFGDDFYIARARDSLEGMNGGMELFLRLASFNPLTRATPLDVMNSHFMEDLREVPGTEYKADELVKSYTAFATHG